MKVMWRLYRLLFLFLFVGHAVNKIDQVRNLVGAKFDSFIEGPVYNDYSRTTLLQYLPKKTQKDLPALKSVFSGEESEKLCNWFTAK